MAEDGSTQSVGERMVNAVSKIARRQERREKLKELIRETIRDTGVRPSEEFEEDSLSEGPDAPHHGEGLIDKVWRIENRLFQIQTQLEASQRDASTIPEVPLFGPESIDSGSTNSGHNSAEQIHRHLFRVQLQLESISKKLSWALWLLVGSLVWFLVTHR